MKASSFLMFGFLLMACGESAVSAPKVPAAPAPPAAAAPPPTSSGTAAGTKTAAVPVTTPSGFRFQDPVYPEDASRKLVMDAPASAKAEKSNDGQEVSAGPHFHLWIGPGWESNLGKDDRKSGYGLTDIKWAKREEKEIVYQAKSREKMTWLAEVMVDVPSVQEGEGAETYRCAVEQSIMEPESFTKADVDAMLAACRSLHRVK